MGNSVGRFVEIGSNVDHAERTTKCAEGMGADDFLKFRNLEVRIPGLKVPIFSYKISELGIAASSKNFGSQNSEFRIVKKFWKSEVRIPKIGIPPSTGVPERFYNAQHQRRVKEHGQLKSTGAQ
uniref:Uncharacterized protein n=1 Tax=Globodera rostochiensis TaxID=31243 RepID=A0A914HU38_GLORO